MRNYVYALIDPSRDKAPFYIGKGMDSRLQSHFKAADKLDGRNDPEVVGCDTFSILEDATDHRAVERLARIVELRNKGFDHTHVARIVARRLDENTAFAVEAFLIRNVYGLSSLTNRVEGTHADRFRGRGDDRHLDGFDMDIGISDARLREIEARFGRYYVYTLRDPDADRVFYVGKGTGRRMFAHFADAVNAGDSTFNEGHLPYLAKLVGGGRHARDAGFDFLFMYWYMIRFAGESPFSFSALDMKTFAMSLLKCDYRNATKRNMPKAWFTDRPHTHKALDDALGQGELFCRMLAVNRSNP